MQFRDQIHGAYKGLRANLSRTLLTVLGIVIGITAIILVVAVGDGAESLILNQIEGIGSRTIVIEPGRMPEGPGDFTEVYTDSLKERDLDALENSVNVQGLDDVTPMVIQIVPFSFGDEVIRKSVVGTSERIMAILDFDINEGVFLTKEDISQKASVVVLGYEMQHDLFGESDAVGENIKVNNKTYRVIGTIPKKGQVAFMDIDNTAFVPYTTAQQYITGTSHFGAIFARAANEDIVPRVVRDVELTLREVHEIDDPDKDDFHVTTQADAVEMVGIITSVLTALLSSVAAVSLVVGGIGIMNIMLVSVAERTREIGLRKALGATDSDVMLQFIYESVILTALGGLVGILFGALFAFIASLVLTQVLNQTWAFSFPLSAAILGLGVSGLVGLVFGLYPARKASQKSPMEALRYE